MRIPGPTNYLTHLPLHLLNPHPTPQSQALATMLGEQVNKGGRVIWRSAALRPPYAPLIAAAGFKVRGWTRVDYTQDGACTQFPTAHQLPKYPPPPLPQVRRVSSIEQGCMDRVNMYASFYVAERL